MPVLFRKRRRLHWPITLSVTLMALNVALMVLWIIIFARYSSWSALTVGTVVFALIIIGLVFYLVLTINEVKLNQRQANFIDSVTHELKTPIASLQLYLQTLQMREIDEPQRTDFYSVMNAELNRLDHLISQLLEVGRLDAIGQETDPEEIEMEPLLRRCAHIAAAHQDCDEERAFSFDVEPAVIYARRIVLEMIFGNLLDNALKYGGLEPHVEVEVRVNGRGRVVTRICDNGEGVPAELRNKIFRMFYRGGSELERRRTGTGLGLYIAHTLVHTLKGTIVVHGRDGRPGSMFEVELPGEIGA